MSKVLSVASVFLLALPALSNATAPLKYLLPTDIRLGITTLKIVRGTSDTFQITNEVKAENFPLNNVVVSYRLNENELKVTGATSTNIQRLAIGEKITLSVISQLKPGIEKSIAGFSVEYDFPRAENLEFIEAHRADLYPDDRLREDIKDTIISMPSGKRSADGSVFVLRRNLSVVPVVSPQQHSWLRKMISPIAGFFKNIFSFFRLSFGP